MADPIEDKIDELLALGITAEQVASRAQARAAEPTKQYFLQELIDPNLSPRDYAFKVRVTNWTSVRAFLAKQPTEPFNAQRIYQSIRRDIVESIAAEDEEKFGLTLMLGIKAAS